MHEQVYVTESGLWFRVRDRYLKNLYVHMSHHFDDTADRDIDVYVFRKLADAWVCHGLFGRALMN